MRHLLLSLIAAAAALPLLASCSATVAPDNYGYATPTYYNSSPGYYNSSPAYYSAAPTYYYSNPYPRYHEYHPYAYRPNYRHEDEHRHVVVERHEEPGIHGQITVDR